MLHYPPVRDAIFPRGKDEAQIERYLSRSATAGGLRPGSWSSAAMCITMSATIATASLYLVSGGGGAKPVPVLRMSHELSKLRTRVNFHYLRFTLAGERLTGTMVRFDADANAAAIHGPSRIGSRPPTARAHRARPWRRRLPGPRADFIVRRAAS